MQQITKLDNSIVSLIEYVLCFLNIHCIFNREAGIKIQWIGLEKIGVAIVFSDKNYSICTISIN